MSRKSRASSQRGRRVTTANANRRLPTPLSKSISLPRSDFREFEDRRTFHPERSSRRPRSFSGTAKLTISHAVNNKESYNFPDSQRVAFATPEKVLICVRRKIREQVLHALRKTGKAGQKKPRRTPYSEVTC